MAYIIKPIGKVYCIIDAKTKKMLESFKDFTKANDFVKKLVGGITQK